MRCLSCEYSLKNLTEHRCPECGRAFDPDDQETFDNEPLENVRANRIALALTGFSFSMFVFTVFVGLPTRRSLFGFLLAAFVAASVFLAFIKLGSFVLMLQFWWKHYRS